MARRAIWYRKPRGGMRRVQEIPCTIEKVIGDHTQIRVFSWRGRPRYEIVKSKNVKEV